MLVKFELRSERTHFDQQVILMLVECHGKLICDFHILIIHDLHPIARNDVPVLRLDSGHEKIQLPLCRLLDRLLIMIFYVSYVTMDVLIAL